jgi:hypothetical protein
MIVENDYLMLQHLPDERWRNMRGKSSPCEKQGDICFYRSYPPSMRIRLWQMYHSYKSATNDKAGRQSFKLRDPAFFNNSKSNFHKRIYRLD